MSSEKTLHDVKTILNRLEIIADLLCRKDFSSFSQDEIQQDMQQDLVRLEQLLRSLAQ
jgi:uncharacterized protein YqgQ